MFITDDSINNLHITIGQNVKELRTQKGLSQLDLTLEMGSKSIGFISRCENFKDGHHFNIEHLYKIAIILKCDIYDFFKGINLKE